MEQVKEEEEEASVASYRIEEHFGWMLHWDKGLQIVAILLHLLSHPPTGFSSPISALFLAQCCCRARGGGGDCPGKCFRITI